ncbi:hypothetical protein GCM10029976_016860 [Kribbella albertanoniae]|uniref:Arsenate reductase n=1 Tax=Kribbella albertanoniae TaxID=1266829 RepID=A0A4R4Q6Y5_9ACTN|nr:hypothetical protein [Kribbella albertanoniae]TDC30890.1 hypothetical protein E1261_12120 [Kribbella albertanoniae]
MTWVPDACTLPTAEQPLRVAEFDQLFADHLVAADRIDAQILDLVLGAESHDSVVDLIARESGCCSFFTFTLTESTGRINLRIEVPPTQTAVLDGLADRLPR